MHKEANMTLTDKEVQAILTSLEAIEVHGFDNMNRLMGIIGFIRQKQQEQTKEEQNG